MKISIEINIDAIDDETDLLNQLGYALEKGTLFKEDKKTAYQLYLLSAKSGDLIGMNNLGWMYQNGYGVQQDVYHALSVYFLAAEMGSTDAMINIGNIYEFGCADISIDYSKAILWYKKAASDGDLKGLFNYANMLHWGYGTEVDRENAYRIFNELYELGYPGVEFYLGLYHQLGYVVEKDLKRAQDYYEEGMHKDDAFCIHQLGVMCARGEMEGVEISQALKYFEKAAMLGDILSITNIAHVYEVGEGVEKDMEKAVSLYKIAAESGEEHAIQALMRLDSQS